jgi:type II secretory pathway pseudopilin PulG
MTTTATEPNYKNGSYRHIISLYKRYFIRIHKSHHRDKSYSLSAGFTIVETIIVLAIAGLILMIVFLAIPTLERNSRNNLRKQDVSLMLQAVSHYELVDSGNVPDSCGTRPGALLGTQPLNGHYCDAAIANSNDNFLRYDAGNLRQYVATDITFVNQSADSVSSMAIDAAGDNISPVTNSNEVLIYNFEQCNQYSDGGTEVGAGYNTVVALFAIEEASGVASSQCLDLAS